MWSHIPCTACDVNSVCFNGHHLTTLTSKQKINEHDLVKQAGKQLLPDTYIIIT